MSNSEITAPEPPEVSYALSQHARDRLSERTTLTEPQLLLLLERKAYKRVHKRKAVDISRDELKSLLITSGKTFTELEDQGVIRLTGYSYEHLIVWSCPDKKPFTLILATGPNNKKIVVTILYSEDFSIHDWSDKITEKQILFAKHKSEALDIENRLQGFQEGRLVSGAVREILNYGALIDLDGIDGLVHISDLAWHRVTHPSEVLDLGEEVNAKVLRVDLVKHRISLGIKQLHEDPWEGISSRYPSNSRVFGTVTKLSHFGVFIEIESGIEGLMHTSEIDPLATVNVGDEIEVVIIEINESRRRISLGLPISVRLPPEKVAYWYLRLNGFLQIENFVVHPGTRGGQRTDADLLAVRFQHRAEFLHDHPGQPMQDDVDALALSEHLIDVVIAEIKTNQPCTLNGPWTREGSQNVHRVLAAIGCIPRKKIDIAARDIYREGYHEGDGLRVRLIAVGRDRNVDYDNQYPKIVQLIWPQVLNFIWSRFEKYRAQKTQVDQWDIQGKAIKRLADSALDQCDFREKAMKLMGVRG